LAKQFGVSDEALAGLRDPARHPFPPDQRAAVLFADAMTSGPGQVPEPLYDDLQRHFSEPQIVEIACVVGLFNYFNRFNNALHVAITLMDPDLLVRRVEEAAAADVSLPELFDRVAGMLKEGRRYARVEISKGEDGTSAAAGELVVPIRAAGKVVGVIRVGTDRGAAFDDEDRSLLERVAEVLAPRMA
jgi:GAF domain-containing protein